MSTAKLSSAVPVVRDMIGPSTLAKDPRVTKISVCDLLSTVLKKRDGMTRLCLIVHFLGASSACRAFNTVSADKAVCAIEAVGAVNGISVLSDM